MKLYAALLPLSVMIPFAVTQAVASTPPMVARNSEPVSQSHFFKGSSSVASDTSDSNRSHLFAVRDAKGLLLTCIAPEMDTDPETDKFNNCTLAPGRTLEDVMHTFIQAIHHVQDEAIKNRAESQKDIEEKRAK